MPDDSGEPQPPAIGLPRDVASFVEQDGQTFLFVGTSPITAWKLDPDPSSGNPLVYIGALCDSEGYGAWRGAFVGSTHAFFIGAMWNVLPEETLSGSASTPRIPDRVAFFAQINELPRPLVLAARARRSCSPLDLDTRSRPSATPSQALASPVFNSPGPNHTHRSASMSSWPSWLRSPTVESPPPNPRFDSGMVKVQEAGRRRFTLPAAAETGLRTAVGLGESGWWGGGPWGCCAGSRRGGSGS